MRFILLILLVCLPLLGSAQNNEFIDSIKLSLKRRPYISINYGSRNSFIANRKAVVNQYALGLSYGDNFGWGLGYHSLRFPDLILERQVSNPEMPVLAYHAYIQYLALYTEYTFYRTKHWIFTIPVQLGAGQYRERMISPANQPYRNNHFVAMYEATMKGTYKFTRYFGIGADVGYRLLLAGNRTVKKFNSPIYVFSFKIFYGALYEDLKKKTGWNLP